MESRSTAGKHVVRGSLLVEDAADDKRANKDGGKEHQEGADVRAEQQRSRLDSCFHVVFAVLTRILSIVDERPATVR